MASPSVSVIIPAYNASRTLRACLESVLAAEYDGEVEVIVVDDTSTDDTAAIAADLGCRVIRRDGNGGPAVARNAGAGEARSDILLFIDADTEMRRDTIREGVRAISRKGVGAATGIYEPEPINTGFFPRYYAYLKFHAFTSSGADRITAFGAQCAVISKCLFDMVGGYRSVPWGVDVENEELGHRINQQSVIALSRDFRVRHNFPDFRKLIYVFTNRVYWWVLFSHFSKQNETVLMTRGFGYATAAPLAAVLSALLAAAVPAAPASTMLRAAAAALIGVFVWGYLGFWRFCMHRRGILFASGAALASVFFSFLVTVSALRGYLTAARLTMRRREPPFACTALGQR